MAYLPISGSIPQFQQNADGQAANAYYLKGYEAGTVVPLSMGVDSTPSSTLAQCALNSRGEPISNAADEDTVFIPHFNETYKLVLYTNVTDATNDATGNAAWVVDNITGLFDSSLIGYRTGTTVGEFLDNLHVDSYLSLRGLTSSQLSDGDAIVVTNEGIAGQFVVKTGAVTDNGGTLIVFTDDSSRYAERIVSETSMLSVKWFGASGDGVTDDTTSINSCISAAANLQNIFFPDGTYLVSSTIDSARSIIGDRFAVITPDAAGSYTNNTSSKKIVVNMARAGSTIRDIRFDLTGKTNFVAVRLALQWARMESCSVACDTDTDGNYGCSSNSNAQIVQFNIFERCDIGYRMEFEGFSNRVFSNQFELCGDCVAIDTSGVTATNYPITHNTFNFPKRTGVLVDCSSADFRNIIVMNNYYESTDNNTIFVSFTNPAFIQGTIAHNLVLGNVSNTGQLGIYPASLPAAVELLIMGNSFARLDTALNVNNSTLIANEYLGVTTRNASSSNTGTIEERIRIEDKSGSDNIVIRPGAFVGGVSGGLTFSNSGNINFDISGANAVRFDNDSTSGNTRFLVYDVDNGTLERVTVGATDSGGSGFKVLRIPN